MRILRFYHTPGPHPRIVGPYLPRPLFLTMHMNVPIVCVDMVVKYKNEFLLVKRANPPERGKWFVPGGRIAKNETLATAVGRKLFEETGLKAGAPEFLMLAEHFNVKEYLPRGNSHFITFVFLVHVRSKKSVRLDAQSSEARWFSKIPRDLHPYGKEALRAAGLR
jgi:colanic acid biosynthesis protein WcaH